MGRKGRNSSRSKTGPTGRTQRIAGPDESIQFGPIRLSRWDTVVVFENLATPAEQSALQELQAAAYDPLCNEIDGYVRRIVEIIQPTDPIALLTRAYWDFLWTNVESPPEESKTSRDQHIAVQVLDYVQQLIGGIAPTSDATIQDKDYAELTDLIEKVYGRIMPHFFIARTAKLRRESGYDPALDEFKVFTEMNRTMVRGHRYQTQEIEHHLDLLEPQNGLLKLAFGIDAKELCSGLEALLRSLSRGVFEAANDMESFMEESLAAIGELKKSMGAGQLPEPALLMEQVVKENGWEQRQARILGALFGSEAFDVAKVTGWPAALVEALSMEPGKDPDYLDGEHKGWPTKVSRAVFCPFVKWKGRSFCFNLQGITDYLYRAVQKATIRARPDMSQCWADSQKRVTEELPITLLSRILRKAVALQNVHYRTCTGTQGKRDWAECDGVLIYDRHLIVVEVKSGSYTYTSADIDLSAHLQSVEELVVKPISQVNRLIDELKRQGVLELCDDAHQIIRTICMDDVDATVGCCITLDQLDFVTAQLSQVNKLNLSVGARPIWSVSLDDLRVHSDIFTNPVIFLDFVHERMRAYCCSRLMMRDELDHLGAYLHHNRYVTYVEKFKGEGPVSLSAGYRDALDRYYSAKWRGATPVVPTQEMPRRVMQIVDLLGHSQQPGRTLAARKLLALNGAARCDLAEGIDEILKLQRKLGRARPITLTGSSALTVFCDQRPRALSSFEDAVTHTLAVMDIEKAESWSVLFLRYAAEGFLERVSWKHLSTKDLREVDKNTHGDIRERLLLSRAKLTMKDHGKSGAKWIA